MYTGFCVQCHSVAFNLFCLFKIMKMNIGVRGFPLLDCSDFLLFRNFWRDRFSKTFLFTFIYSWYMYHFTSILSLDAKKTWNCEGHISLIIIFKKRVRIKPLNIMYYLKLLYTNWIKNYHKPRPLYELSFIASW